MKKLFAFLAEEVGYFSLLAFAFLRCADRLDGVSLIAVLAFPAIAIAGATMVQWLLQKAVKEKLIRQLKYMGQGLYSMLTICLVFTAFYASYAALEYFGNMPASTRTLAFISLFSTLAHLMISSMPEEH